MRIPSQFNEDSLYRRKARSAQSLQSHRRLIRLVVGLVLVLVLMRQASRPELYQVFFGAPASQQAAPADLVWPIADEDLRPAIPPVAVDAAERKVADELVAALAPSDQRRWTVAFSCWQRGEMVPEFPSTADLLRERLESLEPLSDERRQAWLAMLQALAQRVATQQGSEPLERPDAATQPLVAGMLLALDHAAESRVVDGTVWRSGDFDAFYRYLDQSIEFSPRGLAATGVLPLLQQPDVFRGQLLRVHGTVARAEVRQATENVFGIDSYWELWLRPADGADRPLVVIVPRVSDSVAAVGQGSAAQQGPPVMVVGRFLKRLAYTSSIGADLAPVIIGRLIVAEPKAGADADAGQSTAEASGAGSPGMLVITVLAACGLGLSLAVIAMWRTRAAADDSRRIRYAHRGNPDFDGLSQPQSDADPNVQSPTGADPS
jgi:hypothetical protein